MFKTIVGSRVQGLEGPNSDTDVKGVYVASFAELCDPFTQLPSGQGKWHPNGGAEIDEYTYELQHFCKLLSASNPTALECLYSNLVLETSPLGDELRANADRFIDGWGAKQAFEGYARQQAFRLTLGKTEDIRVLSEQLSKHGNTKPLVHRLRILEQGYTLAVKGEFKLQSSNKHMLRRLKFTPDEPTVTAAILLAQEYTLDIGKLRPETCWQGRQDRVWIKDFCKRAYLAGVEDEKTSDR